MTYSSASSGQQRPLQPLSGDPQPRLNLPQKRKKLWAWLLIIGCGIVLLVGVLTVVGYFWYKNALTPVSTSEQRIEVEVAQGATLSTVASQLQEKQVIKSGLAFTIYARLQNQTALQAGHYIFSPNQTPQEVLSWLNQGRTDTFRLTILPGHTLVQIKDKFVNYGYSATEVDAAFAKRYNHPVLVDKPPAASLEGYIFPETHFVSPATSVEDIINMSLDLLQKHISDRNLQPQLQQKGLDLYQAITLASMVEKEVAVFEDRQQVAQVFLSRLQESMHLASDPTYKYAATLLGVPANHEVDSPYNTYRVIGLPPGPISNFTIDSLVAVANPAQGDYLFFVSGDDGTTHFAHTFEQHQENIRLYCQELCVSY